MSQEGQLLDQKSLRAVTGKTADWNEIAKDCIAFANATIFLNLHPYRPEVVNPGPLPLGIAPQNILHTTVRRRIHQLVGLEIPRSRVRRAVEQLVKEGKLCKDGVRSGTCHRLP